MIGARDMLTKERNRNAKSKLQKLIDQFDSGDYDQNSFKEVDVTVSKSAKSVFMVPLESSHYQNLVRIAKEKKITVEKGRWE